ncbi:MAG: beta-propeller fold lactonase family protein, partial [Saprospiraceae bacterium]
LISTLPDSYVGNNTTADIHLSKDGKRLYASNRGHDSIAVFRVNAGNQLESIGFVDTHGKTPRNFHLTDDGHWMLVANQDTGNIALFDLQQGDLPVLVKSVAVGTPVCIVE